MRLTLRTLLAHLDRTLEADDDAVIAAKLRESEFAGNLVRRIQSCISSPQLGAPSPVSTGTADDPNRIGEYLDSVLSAEQVAEVERICLESDGHLAEVAACHQVLTLVLGNPADIPAALRSRVLELGYRSLNDSGTLVGMGGASGRGSAISLTESSRANEAITKAIAADQGPVPVAPPQANLVLPVGPDDSGVSNAPTRLREFAGNAAQVTQNAPAMAGSRRINAAEASELFGRPSRVMPWLVSLALIAAFFFVAAQAFAPLLRKNQLAATDPVPAPQPQTERPTQTEEQNVAPNSATTTDATATNPDPVTPESTEIDAEIAPQMVELDPAAPKTEIMEDLPPPAVAPTTDANTPPPAPVVQNGTPVQVSEQQTLPANGEDESMPAPVTAATEPMDTAPAPSEAEVMPPAEDMEAVAPTDAVSPESNAIADLLPNSQLVSDGSLFLMRKPNEENFFLAKKDEPIVNGSLLVCAPTYRDQIRLLGQYQATLVGSTVVSASSDRQIPLTLALRTGRMLLKPSPQLPADPADKEITEPVANLAEAPLRLSLDGTSHALAFEDLESVAAVEVQHKRMAGSDPEEPGSSSAIISVLAVRGTLQWQSEGAEAITLASGEMLQWSGNGEPVRSMPESIPAWIEPPAPVPGSLEASAREGLLALVRSNESIELSLREAISFRRAEVGALAAQTLVLIERPAVCFGADGVLYDEKQKNFWPDHFKALVAAIDRGPESAAVVREAIDQMDAAESTAIYRMLWLFSNDQLAAGSDELLVRSLDHANMTVRVLAIENLRAITGTTLFYKPETETAPRRASDIKKWETRLRKGDIRWPVELTDQPKNAPQP